jgi:hypothetical protein
MSPTNYRIPAPNQGESFNTIQALLKISLETKKIIILFTNDENYLEFSAGIVIALSEFWFVMQRVDINGRADGFACVPIDIVFRAESDTTLANRIALLWKIQEEELTSLDLKDEDFLKGFLDIARQKQYVVSLEILDSRRNDLSGFIQQLDESFAKIAMLDMTGNASGSSLIALDSITQVVMDATEQKTLFRLFDHNKRIGNLT